MILQGDSYTSSSKKIVSAKQFNAVQCCCPKNCFEKVNVPAQESFFNSFWKSAGNYKSQNIMLAGLIKRKIHNSHESAQNNITLWEYSFHSVTHHIVVCQKFLLTLLSVGKGRFTGIQKKLLNNESLQDNRGLHSKRTVRLTEELKQLIQEHCLQIPHSPSHYNSKNTQLFYFDHSDLTLTKLYQLFIEYYTLKTGNSESPLSESTYSKYFNHNLNFTFSKPRTDVCNFCFEHKDNVENNIELENHLRNVKEYKLLKQAMLSEKEVLCLEFDFGQNLPMPKIPVSEQFYRRLIWLHIFNVHVFGNHKRSYMYLFTEGNFKKGGNTVCNFLYDALKRELKTGYYEKIYLFSDSCGGQNKNYLVLSFLSLLSKKLQVEIKHIYPVRGHSYCSCDRNFGMYGQKKKQTEIIETASEYIQLIKNARNPPFIIIRETEITVNDFELLIPKEVQFPKNVQISEAVKITYFPNGQFNVYKTYTDSPIEFILTSSIEIDDLLKTSRALPVGISKEKINDVQKLLRFLSPEGQTYFKDLIKNCNTKAPKVTLNQKKS